MKCPICELELKIADRQGIEIDYCPQCRGIWLDRGELDKLIDRSNAAAAAPPPPPQPRPQYQERQEYQAPPPPPRYPEGHHGHGHGYAHNDPHGYHGKHGYPHGRKRKSFLEEIFDFD